MNGGPGAPKGRGGRALSGILLLALGCAPSAPPSDRVIHLDPRLEDGRSSAVVLSDSVEVVARFDLRGRESLPASWSLVNGVLRGTGARGGLVVKPTGARSGSLLFEGQVDTRAVNLVEVDVAMLHSSRPVLFWGGPEPLLGVRKSADTADEAAGVTLVFDLSAAEQWQGVQQRLLFSLASDRAQPLEVFELRFLHRPFSMGSSPGLWSEVPSGDGGLPRDSGETWRSWPLPLGVPLIAEAQLPKGAQLSARIQSRSAEATLCEVRVEVDGEDSALVEWQLGASHGEWIAMHADLSPWAGETARIRFLVPGSPDREQVGALLGAPLITAELPADRRPNLLLITLDTTRFDALGSSNVEGVQELVSTPALDALAARSFVFQDAWSPANSTQPAHASLLTGTAVQDHSLFDNFGVLAEANVTLAERLRAAGYETLGASSQPAIGPTAGFGQGFDGFVPPTPERSADGRLAMNIVERWLGDFERDGQRPFFLWLHLFDAHAPYELPEGQLERFAAVTGQALPPKWIEPPTLPQAKVMPAYISFLGKVNSREHVSYLYRAEVSYLDQLLEGLFETLERDGIAQHTMVVLTADHGEFLGERGNFYNHKGLFPETVKVPLMIHLPGQTTGGVVQARVSTLDLAPTLLAQLGLDGADSQRDLIALAEGRTQRPSRERVWFEHANGLQVGCRDSEYYFILTLREGMHFGTELDPKTGFARARTIPLGSVFLYDLKADPNLEHNLAPERPELVERYRDLFEQYRASAKPVGSTRRSITREQEAQLDALGYTGD